MLQGVIFSLIWWVGGFHLACVPQARCGPSALPTAARPNFFQVRAYGPAPGQQGQKFSRCGPSALPQANRAKKMKFPSAAPRPCPRLAGLAWPGLGQKFKTCSLNPTKSLGLWAMLAQQAACLHHTWGLGHAAWATLWAIGA